MTCSTALDGEANNSIFRIADFGQKVEKNNQWLKAKTAFKSWFFILIPQPLKSCLSLMYLWPLLDTLGSGQNSDDQTEDVSDNFTLEYTYCAVAPV